MSTSGTYTFDPTLGEIVLYAFNNIGVRPASLTQEHMQNARMAANMLQSRWSNQGVNLWAVDLVTVPLVAGTATYAVDASTVMILDAYLNVTSDAIDRIVLPISRSEYASYPEKALQGFSTVYWFDRLTSPSVTLWPVPDGTSANYFKYYRVRQIQDAEVANGGNTEIPYLWLEAFADGMSYRLARAWKPEVAPAWKAVADESYEIAAAQNTEYASFYISPLVSGYYR